MISVLKNGQAVSSYVYDESGLRLKKQGTAGSTYYAFDTGGNVLYEQENRDYLEYVYVLGKHFARVDGNLDNLNDTNKYFYQTDNLGSTVLVTDEDGKQVWSAEYTPFGKQTAADGKLDHVTQFTGKDLDEDTGLYYFNARWYDEEIGRFISEDPKFDPNNSNLYWYCNNNPLTNVDPDGQATQSAAQQIYRDWQSYWLPIASSAHQQESAMRRDLWKKDPAAYSRNSELFASGKSDAFGSKYQAVYNLSQYSSMMLDNAPEVQNWIEAQVASGHKPTLEEINDAAVQIAKGKDFIASYIEPIVLGGMTWAQVRAGESNFDNRTEIINTRGVVTSDTDILIRKAALAENGDISARTELQVAQYLQYQGNDVHFIDDMAGGRTNDFTVNGKFQVDVKRISGLGRNAAGDLAKGVRQVGPGGEVIVVRPTNSHFTLEQYQQFVRNFVPQELNVTIRVIDESLLPNYQIK